MQDNSLHKSFMGAVGELSSDEKEELESVINKVLENKIDTDSYSYYRKVLAKFLKAEYYLDIKEVSNNEINRWIPGIRAMTKNLKKAKEIEQQRYLAEIEEENVNFQKLINPNNK